MKINKKAREVLFSCIILIISSLIFSGCSSGEIFNMNSSGYISEYPEGLYVDGEKTDIIPPRYETAMYGSLNEDERNIYASAYTALCLGKNAFTVCGVDYDLYLTIYTDAIFALIRDFPEFFWLDGYVEASAEFQEGLTVGDVTIILGIYDYWKENDISAAELALDSEVQRIAEGASEIPTEFERVQYVHDRIINTVEYDVASYEFGDNVTKEAKAKSNGAYGALIDGTALCGGYASAFMLVTRELGMDCEFIAGMADGDPHAWNMIKLDGDYYHIDLTWDDLDGTEFEQIYSYFCLNEKQISATHEPYNEFDFLVADAIGCNYHVYNGLYIEEYSFGLIDKMTAGYKGKEIFSVKCSDAEVFNKLEKELVTENKIYELACFSSVESYNYMLDRDVCVFMFWFN